MNSNREVFRELARQYKEIAENPVNQERAKLYRGVNDLKQIRPVVLIDELPWSEMNFNGELTCVSEDPAMRGAEWYMRSTIYKWKYLQADMIVEPFFPIMKQIRTTGNGVSVKEETLATDSGNGIVSHKYEDQLATEEALAQLRSPVITYDEAATMKDLEMKSEMFGDILPCKLVGTHCGAGTWDEISNYRGVTNLLFDLIERPEFTHKMVEKFTEIRRDVFAQYEALNLFAARMTTVHCTPALSDSLPSKDFDGQHVKMKDTWGRAVAQIFASVSPDMHDEFDIEYAKGLMEPFGLVYYGCCEPLDRKIDIVEKIPNLRKISITPWADVDNAAEKIGKKYVLSSKPNPSSVSVANLDEVALRAELKKILDACKRNGCACDLVLKDISSVGHNPQNLFKWEQIAMEMVRNY